MTSSPKEPVTGWQRDVVVRVDRLLYNFSRHWLAVFNVIIAIYVGLPILAPVLMKAGARGPANVIYTVYSPMCHQMASRSFFLFGEQIAYPRQLAAGNLKPLEAYAADIPEFAGVNPDNWVSFFLAARRFVGNEELGYKMALCERDIAIYGFVLLGGLVYGLLRRRYHVKPLPLLAFVIIGMGPIALDGFSQLFGYYASLFEPVEASAAIAFIQRIFPLRESTPLLRTLTGALFGFMLVWLAYPRIEEGMQGTERDLERKLRRIGEIE